MIYLAFLLVLAIVGYWIHVDTKYQVHRRRWARRDANLSIYHERRDEGGQTEETDSDQKQDPEAEVLLLDDIGQDSVQQRTIRGTPWLPYATIATLGVFTLTGYLLWGDPLAIRLESVPAQLRNVYELANEEDLDKVIELLKRRDSSRLGDMSSSTYLIHSYFVKGDMESVIREHKLAEERGKNSHMSDIRRVQAAFEVDDQQLTEETQVVIQRVLEQEPENPTMMQLLAIHSYSRNQFVDARGYLEKALRQPLPQTATELFDRLLSKTISNLDDDHIGIWVSLEISNLATPHQWITVFAQADDNSPPIAVVRRPYATNGRYTFLLDDVVSMIPERKLSSFDRVTVVARLSPSTNVSDTENMSQIQSGWIAPAPQASVSLRLSELTTSDSVTVTVALDNNMPIQGDWPVFIIGRRIDEPGPPLAVKRVVVSDLPITLTLSEADAMLPNAEFPDDEFEVVARASSTGSASRSPNDIESSAVRVRVGQRVGLRLNKVVDEAEESSEAIGL